MVGVHGGDDRDGDEVVDDGDGEQEGTETLGSTRRDQCEHPERERSVRGHRRCPAVLGGTARIGGEVDRDRNQHPTDRGEERHRDAPPFAKLADIELPPRLQPDDEEEERHQAAVHPVTEVLRDAMATGTDR